MFDCLANSRFVGKDQAIGARAGYLRWSFTIALKRVDRDWEM